MKIEQDKRVGRDLSNRFAAVHPAPPEEVQALSEQLNVTARLATHRPLAQDHPSAPGLRLTSLPP